MSKFKMIISSSCFNNTEIFGGANKFSLKTKKIIAQNSVPCLQYAAFDMNILRRIHWLRENSVQQRNIKFKNSWIAEICRPFPIYLTNQEQTFRHKILRTVPV